jgi:hypothetical protein
MNSFSWTDSIKATIGTCLPCIKPNADSDDEGAQARRTNGPVSAREELERLLDEPMTDHEDVETMSLHSNVGNTSRRQQKKKPKNGVRKSVRVFGIDLFGRRPISLPEDDGDNEINENRAGPGRTRAISTSTLDSDAAPLADEAITDFTTRAQERWAPSQTDEQLAAEEAEERERVEQQLRKERRKERKEMKRLAEAGAFEDGTDTGFEGFPGSGVGAAPGPDEFGPFVGTQQGAGYGTDNVLHRHTSSDDKDEEEADFDAGAYTKKRRDGGGSHSGSGTHSRSHSRTSASISNEGSRGSMRDPRSTKARNQPSLSRTDDRLSTGQSSDITGKIKTKRSDRSKSKHSNSSATQSLPSPSLVPSHDVKINHEFDGEILYSPFIIKLIGFKVFQVASSARETH